MRISSVTDAAALRHSYRALSNASSSTPSEQQSFRLSWRQDIVNNTRQDDSIKSASAPPRSGAREPSRQLSAFYEDRANRLLEQTETLCTAAHRGRCDVVVTGLLLGG